MFHGMSTQRVECRRDRWKGRPACILSNGVVALTQLSGGGHIADFHFLEAASVNPFWVPHWKLRDPARFRPARDESEYGSTPVGRLLSGIAGHSLCLGVFGMPSAEEIAAGAVLHGEAGVRRWTASLRPGRNEGRVLLSVRLPAFGLMFTRELSLRPGESVIRVRESVRNLLGADQFIQWQQHAAFGPPFLDPRDCVITLAGSRGITDSAGYEGRSALIANAEFTWPLAPGIDGCSVGLERPCQKTGSGFVAGILIDPRREHAFICAVNHAQQLAIGYVFRRSQFPWITLWEENQARTDPPWRGQEQVRGLEFGVSPLPVGRADTIRSGELFGAPTLLRIPARGVVSAAWAMFLCRTPRTVRRVNGIVCQPNRLRLATGAGSALTIRAGSIADFLDAPPQP